MPVGRDNSTSPGAIRAQLVRMLASDLFASSPRMARFLEFAVDETLKGNADQLKENVIGVHVFDRAVDYDPRVDPIVRVEARRLRTKLRAYAERHAQPGDLIVELPKGRYIPQFRLLAGAPASLLPAPSVNAVAVLPFVNLSADPDTDFVSEGLTEDLISALTQVSDLRVLAWTSAARAQKEHEDIDAIRSALNVTFLVRGSIRKSEDRIRILAHLIETSTRRYLWSRTFDRSFAALLSLQDEITHSIVTALQSELSVPAGPLTSSHMARDYKCQELCWKGRSYARDRTVTGLERSAACFELATQADPACVSAFAGLAGTLTLQAEYGFTDVPSTMQQAKAAVDRALELDPASYEALASRGLILTLHDRDWLAGQVAFERSIELNASYAPAHHWYALNHLAMIGHFARARGHLDAAARLDPLSSVVAAGSGFLAFLNRHYEQAISIYQEIAAGDPGFYKIHASMARAYLHCGDVPRAIALLEKSIVLGDAVPTVFGVLGQAYGIAGDTRKADEVLRQLRLMASLRPVPSTCFALVHAGMGDGAQAIAALERAVERRESSVVSLAVHPAYDSLRGDPRFAALTRRVLAGAELTVS